jgi:hypothetical protein
MDRKKQYPAVEHVVRRNSKENQNYKRKTTNIDKDKRIRLLNALKKCSDEVSLSLVRLRLKIEEFRTYSNKLM